MDSSQEYIPASYGDMLHAVFDQSSQGLQVINRSWEYVFVNKAVAKHGRSTPEALMGHTMMEMYPGIDKTPLFVQLKRCMEERVSISMETQFTYPDGRQGWFQLYIHPWSDGIIIFSIDMTDRKHDEQLVHKHIKAIQAISEHTPEEKQQLAALEALVTKLCNREPVVIKA